MKVILIRHGRTQGNSLGRLIGVTDESLCAEGIEEIRKRTYPHADTVFVSPLKRCVETARLIYGDADLNIVEGMREMNFGIFDNKAHEELKDNSFYIKWLETNCESDVPEGETKREFTDRCTAAFKAALDTAEGDTAFIVHGGTVMAVLSAMTGQEFYSFLLKNGQGYICEYDGKKLTVKDKLE